MRLVCCLVLLFLSLPASAAATLRSISHSEWRIEGSRVTLRIDFPVSEAEALVGKRYPLLSNENVGRYVLERVAASVAGRSCAATDQGYDIGQVSALSLSRDLYGFEIVFLCSGTGVLTLRNAVLMDERQRHVDYATIERGGQRFSQLFTPGSQALELQSSTARGAGPTGFGRLGLMHFAGSLSRLGALLVLLMLAGSRRGLLLGSITTGYALSLLVTALPLQPQAPHLEVGVGFVTVAGVATLLAALRPPRAFRVALLILAVTATALASCRQPSAGLLIAGLVLFAGALLAAQRLTAVLPLAGLGALFGVIDGLTLPGDLARLQLGAPDFSALLAFNGGSMACATLLLGLAWVVMRGLSGSRLFRPTVAMGDLLTSLLSGLGLFWMLSPL